MSVLDCTVVGHEAGKAPEILLEHRPFSDCVSVGSNFLHNTVVKLLGRYVPGLITRENETDDHVPNASGGGTHFVCTERAMLGKAKLATFYVVEN